MNSGQAVKAITPATSVTECLITSMLEKTDQLHKQLYMLTEKIQLVLGEESSNSLQSEDPESPIACRLHERLCHLQENLNSVSRHIHNLTERVVL